MIPQREPACRSFAGQPAGSDRHVPDRRTVEGESNIDMEWQFATCMHCAERISRFRILFGGRWFDQWGAVTDEAYVVGNYDAAG